MNENFNDLDPSTFDESTFDPSNLNGPQMTNNKNLPKRGYSNPSGGNFTSITLKVVNSIAVATTAQWFAPGTGIAAMVNDTTINAFNAATPENIVGAANLNSTFYFDKSGNLITQSAAGTKMTQSINEIPYRQFLNGIFWGGFMIRRVRATFTTDAQIDNLFTFRELTMFGKTGDQDTLNPRAYFNPDQFQGKIVDVAFNWYINQERAMYMSVNSGETLTMVLTIDNVYKTPKK